MPQPKQDTFNQTERLIDAIDSLSYGISLIKDKDYTQILIGLMSSLKEIGNGYTGDGCLNKIHHELKILNKNIILAALLTSAPENPEQTLNEYNKVIEKYLN